MAERLERARLSRRKHEKQRKKKKASRESIKRSRPAPAPFRVYLITNTVTGEKYVGVTTRTLIGRWAKHRERAKDGSPATLPTAIRTYGAAVFSIQVLSEALNRTAAYRLERFWIRELRTAVPAGYNETDGGRTGFTWSEPTRARMKASVLAKRKQALCI